MLYHFCCKLHGVICFLHKLGKSIGTLCTEIMNGNLNIFHVYCANHKVAEYRTYIMALGRGIHSYKNSRKKRLHVITYLNNVISKKRTIYHSDVTRATWRLKSSRFVRLANKPAEATQKEKATFCQPCWWESLLSEKGQHCGKRLFVMPSSSNVQWEGTCVVSVWHDAMWRPTRSSTLFQIDGLMQKIRNSSTLSMEIRLSWINPSR